MLLLRLKPGIIAGSWLMQVARLLSELFPSCLVITVREGRALAMGSEWSGRLLRGQGISGHSWPLPGRELVC